jgi:mannose-6-phosphate isomerase-like protein (cupin superfamily)
MPILRAPAAPTHHLHGTRFTSLATPSRGTHDNSVWRVEIGPDTVGAVHELTREEILIVLSGRARVRIGAVESEAGAGDTIVVPPATPFQLSTGAEPLCALVCLPVGGQGQLPGGAPFTPPWAQ